MLFVAYRKESTGRKKHVARASFGRRDAKNAKKYVPDVAILDAEVSISLEQWVLGAMIFLRISQAKNTHKTGSING
jgi:hypothetical protein